MIQHPAARATLVALGVAAVFAAVSTAASPPDQIERAVAAVAPYTEAHAGVVVNSGVNAGVKVRTPANGTHSIVRINATGLVARASYGVHVHFGTCTDYLGHYRYDLAGPGVRGNEVWLDLVANNAGAASDKVRVPRFNPAGLSLVIHEKANPDLVTDPTGHPGGRIACGNLTEG